MTEFYSLLTHFEPYFCQTLLFLDQEKQKNDLFLTSEGCGKDKYVNTCNASGVHCRGTLLVLVSLL